MISVAEAEARVVAALRPTGPETVSIAEAAGRVLVAAAIAKFDQPPAPVSAMDGYAVRAEDVANVPATLRVIGTSPAGHPFTGKVGEGEAVRIFTGGVVPDGADAIAIQEDADAGAHSVVIKSSAKPGRHIRKAALDFAKGSVLAPAGKRLTARDVALLAAGDVASISVRRKPVIAFAATGDELSRPGEARKQGGIVASSGYGLAEMIARWGGTARDLGIFPDTAEAIARIADADADLIVTLGGASVGDHDLVRKALGPKGFVLDFWKVAMRPGKPLIFGKLCDTPLLGLPGNPVSSLVCAMLFLKPAIAAMLGTSANTKPMTAKLLRELPANDQRQDYLRARSEIRGGELYVEPFIVQDSSMLSILAQADVLVLRAPQAAAARTGDCVDILMLE
ncbi:MAG: molybdopterin molybdotransferase MoeA [Proteobacteria bacterium]|nr:molybdopterin molybdotransferase MoeA [Pseudomonadota bacterium]